jgi:galactokinase
VPGPVAADRCVTAHRARWGDPELVTRAPGRVNLIGEHTDYNDGFTLPMALPFAAAIAATSGGDPVDGPVEIVAEGFGVASIVPRQDPLEVPQWARHIAGVVALMGDHDVQPGGWRATIASDVPAGAGLSSSAAVEVAAIRLLLARAARSWSPLEVARLAQRVENEVIGLPSGIMDPFISAAAVAGCAGLMDCRALTLDPVPISEAAKVAVLDTGTRRLLVDGAYADRRAACERAAAVIGVNSLRDATLEQLGRISAPVDRARARHVIEENARTLAAVDALRGADMKEFGRLMLESHVSLRDVYEVSGAGLDAMVEVALEAPGSFGARMTGGGFAGCAVALVDAASADRFVEHVTNNYAHEGHTARVWLCSPSAGASVVGDAPVSDR